MVESLEPVLLKFQQFDLYIQPELVQYEFKLCQLSIKFFERFELLCQLGFQPQFQLDKFRVLKFSEFIQSEFKLCLVFELNQLQFQLEPIQLF